MPRRDGDRLLLEGALTIDTVPDVLEAGSAHVRAGAFVVDLAAVTEVDSSAVALALALAREGRDATRPVTFENLPPAMLELAQLYGVSGFVFGSR